MIVRTKLRIPHSSVPVVSRPALIAKLDEGMEVRLTLISAQSGYGKTTAMAEWAKQSGIPVAWVSLDRQDNDWIQFWSYVIASVQERLPGFGPEIPSMLASGPSELMEPAIGTLLNELERWAGRLAIVIDDYHTIELEAIHRSMSFLLAHLPEGIHIYMAGRAEPQLRVARLFAKGQVVRIDMRDLCFRLDEGYSFFRDAANLELTREQVRQLVERTEGWVSGLQLAALSMKQSRDIAKYVERFAGRQHRVADDLLQEILHGQTEQIRDFLSDTSILSRMNASLCEAVTGKLDCQAQLEQLESYNMFIIPLDEDREWYRYHHLLSEYLQRRLYGMNVERWLLVHERAAKWLEASGFDEEAVEHYIAGKRYADAVRLIEQNMAVLMQSKSVSLKRWITSLPDDAFAEKPMLEVFYISVLFGVGEWEAAYRRVAAARLRYEWLQDKMLAVEWNRAMGNIYYFCAVSAYLQKDLEEMSVHFERMEACMPEGSLFQTMGRNRYQGFDSFDDHLGYINDLRAAEVFLTRWIGRWGVKEEYPFVGYLYASYSQLLYEWNRLDEAAEVIGRALGRKDVEPFARIEIHMAMTASRIRQALGQPEEAHALLAKLKEKIVSPDRALFMIKIEAQQADLSLQQGKPGPAREWLETCGLSAEDEISPNRVPEYLVLTRVLAALGRAGEALELLRRLDHFLQVEDRLRDRIKVKIQQSLTEHRAGRAEAALAALDAALRLARPQRYIRSFLDEGTDMTELLIAYTRVPRGRPKLSALSAEKVYAGELLRSLKPESADAPPLSVALTGQEAKVIGLLSRGLSNREIAEALGIKSETAKSHIKNIYRKLNAGTRIQALQQAKELNLV
ncbi:LuxR C-terminal-related transcriptional regulator [Cohnella hashimotonis]|uniref:LuxR C-terminal-related transcriptional regulator n=1 Tax=Cohnella hashimotonis TaxID=2826895 RepID=A0ABT6TNI7_9BACL|nr:LuxR C-terminal-related transcriptional regulator [Cohnella hashimotonis]MDI4648375.1 LuxR C-terminal-related transcriptional regulator [Cohnella hashimotonis]